PPKKATALLGVLGILGVALFSLFDWIRIVPKSASGVLADAKTGFTLFRLWNTVRPEGQAGIRALFAALIVLLLVSLGLLTVSFVFSRAKHRKAFVSAGLGLSILVPAAFVVIFLLTPFKEVSKWIAGANDNIISRIQFTRFPLFLFAFSVIAFLFSLAERRGGYNRYHNLAYHSMMAPAAVFLILFNVIPIFGLVIAFKNYQVAKPFFGLTSDWAGLKNFEYIFVKLPQSRQVIINTVIIAVSKIIGFLVTPVAFALLLNECRARWLKRTIQTTVYLPNFLSWVTVGLLFRQMFSPIGLLNTALTGLGLLSEPVSFITSNTWFRPIVIFTDIWKGYGYSAVVYIAAISSIDLNLYEAAAIDGAGRWQRMRFVTVPGIMPTVVLMGTLALGNILNAGFDQIFNMITLPVYKTGEIMDTYIYRIAVEGGAYHRGTAMGMAKSVISMLLIMLSYKLADKYAGYRIF
ncbi:MAG: ABC transporter permease subunit, partial [Syntrophaceae bacterium]|nr:ABC transporter permease subunit [Syntrophaceae bacterium]